jgi:hypothetical protein
MERQNTNYNPDKRQQDNETIYNWTRPFQSMQEQLVSQQLLDNATAEAANRRPPIPNIGKVPNRFGYDRTPPGIADILVVDDSFSAQFGDFSGTESGYAGSSYPSLAQL